MQVSVGFSGVHKLDQWTPVYITLADVHRRNGTLELRTAHGRLGHDVSARVSANPSPQTFTLYAPIGALDRAQIQFRDAAGKLVARQDLSETIAGTPAAFAGTSVGVAGEAATSQRVVNSLNRDTGEFVAAGAIDARLLPERAIGYRAIDVLVLAGFDTDAIDDPVEQAIVDWVRSGGVLVAWPGTQRPSRNSPLGDALPAEFGGIEQRVVAGIERSIRSFEARTSAGDSMIEDGTGVTWRRRIGIGQVVLTAIDPTTLPDPDAAARIARWRRLTDNQFSLTADDRRRGVFDPLVAQSLAEQSISAATNADGLPLRAGFWIGLGLGLFMGPGEMVMLLVANRHPRTGFTIAGLGLTIACGFGLAVVSAPDGSRSPIAAVTVMTDEPAIMYGTGDASVAGNDEATNWFSGDAGDPMRQPAGVARIAMRESRLEMKALWTAKGVASPLSRFVTFGGTIDPSAEPEAVAIVETRSIQIGPTLGEAQSSAPIDSDTAGTRRVETGIERLAAEAGWAPVLLDRSVASRLVRLQESEGTTIVARRYSSSDGTRIHLDVAR